VGVWGPKLKILLKFRDIKAPQGRMPWVIFTKFVSFLSSFRFVHILKFGRIRSRCFKSYWGLNLGVFALPQIFSAN